MVSWALSQLIYPFSPGSEVIRETRELVPRHWKELAVIRIYV